jgi:hypothetical protein
MGSLWERLFQQYEAIQRMSGAGQKRRLTAVRRLPLCPNKEKFREGAGMSQRCQTRSLSALTKQSSDGEFSYECTTTVRSTLPDSFQISRSATNRIPVRAVLKGRPSMFRPETRSPTAVPAALIATTVSQ